MRFHIIHDWSKWTKLGDWVDRHSYTGRAIVGEIHRRTCTICGKVQQKDIWL